MSMSFIKYLPALCAGLIPIPSGYRKTKTNSQHDVYHVYIYIWNKNELATRKIKDNFVPFVMIALVAGGTLNWKGERTHMITSGPSGDGNEEVHNTVQASGKTSTLLLFEIPLLPRILRPQ